MSLMDLLLTSLLIFLKNKHFTHNHKVLHSNMNFNFKPLDRIIILIMCFTIKTKGVSSFCRLWKGYTCWRNNVRFQKNCSSRLVYILPLYPSQFPAYHKLSLLLVLWSHEFSVTSLFSRTKSSLTL